MPTEIIFENNQNKKISYVYDANGAKQKKIVNNNGSLTETLYVGNYVYENNTLQFFNTSEGYVSVENTNNFSYVYNFKDHLNNVRLSYTDANKDGQIAQSEIIKESNYYPFGLAHKGYNNGVSSLGNSVAKRYMFGGKELNEELGLNWYDITARNYDPALGRWFVIDPKADDIVQVDLTPYNYSWNNPINVYDPDGECPWCWGAVIGFAVEYAAQVTTNLIEGQDLGDALTNVDGGKLLVATATGAATGGLSTLKVMGAVQKVYKGMAITTTAAGGNIVNQRIDGNKTINAKELATDVIADKIPLPKVKLPKLNEVTDDVIKTAERQADRAERVAKNPRPSRERAVKEAKKNVKNLKEKKEIAEKVNKSVEKSEEFINAGTKEAPKWILKKTTEEDNQKQETKQNGQ